MLHLAFYKLLCTYVLPINGRSYHTVSLFHILFYCDRSWVSNVSVDIWLNRGRKSIKWGHKMESYIWCWQKSLLPQHALCSQTQHSSLNTLNHFAFKPLVQLSISDILSSLFPLHSVSYTFKIVDIYWGHHSSLYSREEWMWRKWGDFAGLQCLLCIIRKPCKLSICITFKAPRSHLARGMHKGKRWICQTFFRDAMHI